MKTRIITIILLLMILGVLLARNDERITGALLDIINPIKQNYKNFTQEIEEKGHSYLFQKETIEKLSKENLVLRKLLLEQKHYIKQVKKIYDVLPDLSRLPVHNIALTSTISYVKLNSFSQVILTKPKGIRTKKLYGLIQKNVVAGIARLKKNHLYGYLTSNKKCLFSVFIGEEQAPGIAIGLQENMMIVKFIPKWHKIKMGDKVVTSGLDNIFFSGLPVGVVTQVETQSAYKIAYIKTYADLSHPKVFFLVKDARAKLTEAFDSNQTLFPEPPACEEYPSVAQKLGLDNNITSGTQTYHEDNTSSLPAHIDQTQPTVIEPEIPMENTEKTKPKTVKKRKRYKRVKKYRRVKKRKVSRYRKRKHKTKRTKSSLDLF